MFKLNKKPMSNSRKKKICSYCTAYCGVDPVSKYNANPDPNFSNTWCVPANQLQRLPGLTLQMAGLKIDRNSSLSICNQLKNQCQIIEKK